MFQRLDTGAVAFVHEDAPITDDHRITSEFGVPEWLCDLARAPAPDPPALTAPDGYTGTLRPYQQRALGFAEHRERTMLALDCGLGKTHIGICYMLRRLPAVVVCPASLIRSWRDHLQEFAPSVADQVTVVSYNKMHCPEGTRCIVADEAHYLKNERSQRSQRFVEIAPRRALLLTGTPAQRNMDLFHLLKILDSEHFRYFHHHGHSRVPGRMYFAERYTVPAPVWLGGKRHGFKFTTNRRSEELALVSDHYILRMKKDDVVDLPACRSVYQVVAVAPKARAAYYREQMGAVEQVREARGSRQADVLLLSLCREASQEKLPDALAHIERWLERAQHQKALVFYHHKVIGDAIASRMKSALGADGFVRIDGSTPMRVRQKRLAAFQDRCGCRIAVLSLCASSTGLNLQFCTHAFFVELTFLSVHHTQAEARIHRIGQGSEVTVEYLVLQGSTDSLLWHSLQSKRRAEAALFDDARESKRPRPDLEIVPL